MQAMAPGSNQTFLFVNKHASSSTLSRSGHSEQFRILSHVRGQEHRRTPNAQPWMLYTNVIDPTDNESSNDFYPQDLSHTNSRDSVAQRVDGGRSQSSPGVEEHWSTSFDHNNSVCSFLFGKQPSYNSLDPFHCTAGGPDVTPFMHLAGHRVGTNISRITWSAESLEPSTNLARKPKSRHDEARFQRLKECVDNKLLLYSSIAHGSSSRAWVNGDPDDACARFWVGKTLQALRVELTDPESAGSRAVVLSIFTLALTALWNAAPRMWFHEFAVDEGYFATCRIHIQAMLEVIRDAGGWDKFSPYILEGMVLVDKYAALYGNIAPLIPLTFDPGAEGLDFQPSRVPAEDIIPDIATGFRRLSVDRDLAQILADTGRFYHTAAGVWQTKVNLTPQQENHLYLRFQALHYRLLLLNPKPDDWTNHLIRLASLVVLCNITLYSGGLMATDWTSQHLRRMMENGLSWKGAVDEEVWLWCLCTGATTRLPVANRAWFVDQIRLQIDQMSLSSELLAIRETMTKYLYIPWLQDSQLRAAIGD